MKHQEFIERVKTNNFHRFPKVLSGMIAEYCMVQDIDFDTDKWDSLIYELWETFKDELIQCFFDKDDFDFAMSAIFN